MGAFRNIAVGDCFSKGNIFVSGLQALQTEAMSKPAFAPPRNCIFLQRQSVSNCSLVLRDDY